MMLWLAVGLLVSSLFALLPRFAKARWFSGRPGFVSVLGRICLILGLPSVVIANVFANLLVALAEVVAAPIIAVVEVSSWTGEGWRLYSAERCRTILGPHEEKN